MKEARAILAAGKVMSARWEPPRLSGEVMTGNGVIKTGLTIKDHIDVENQCPCKESRQWSRICGHALAVGLGVLHPDKIGSQRPARPDRTGPEGAAKSDRNEDSRTTVPTPLQLGISGHSLRLAVVLPPNLDQSLAVGSVTVFVEAAVNGGKFRPLATLDRSVAYSLAAGQQPLFELVLRLSGGELPTALKLSCAQLTELLAVLPPDSGTFGRKDPVVISEEPFPLPLSVSLLPSGEIQLAAQLPQPLPVIVPGSTTWALVGRKFSRVVVPGGSLALLQRPQTISREQVPYFLHEELPALAATGSLHADFAPEDFEITVRPPQFHLALEGGLAKLRARLSADYGLQVITLPHSDPRRCGENSTSASDRSLFDTAITRTGWLADPDAPRRYRLRDAAAERDALARLARAGFEGPTAEGWLQLTGQEAVLNFFARDYPRLKSDWQVTLEERLDWSLNKNVERIEPSCEIRPVGSGEQWFDFGVQFETAGGERFSNADIQTLIRGGRSHAKLKNGKFALLDTGAVEELDQFLIDAAPQQQAAGYRLRAENAAFLNETVGRKLGWQVVAPSAWLHRVNDRSAAVELDFGGLGDVLRPYQKDGVRWLHQLRANGFGGILADEMGLGKTLQALAHVCLARSSKTESPGLPFLVVCPTSLVFNWQAEAAKFAPHLRVLVFAGPDRHAHVSRFADYDLILTSYALIRRDADAYRPFEFDTVILDEAQHIKNRESQNAQAVKSIRCRHRLVLTGTPMENSVLDLWSIFDFLMPGYLGAARDFRERYELPLGRGRDPALQDRLSRRVRPFILRRLKRDVAKDLPDKLEQVSFCELTADQRAVYQQVLEAGRNEVLAAVGKDGFAKSRMVVFTALLRLRQVCCDLRLLQLGTARIKEPSGKLELFGELLEEIVDGGHRALVFSQFTSMLDLLAERLAGESIEFCRLDGSTKDRGEVVRRFQQGVAPVFLISLKAGGVGLNLTAADTVIHFDPWWNPAVEDQATDRAHRIGQRRVVTSYKLITRDTVEEKILRLQQKKREAIQAVFGDEGALTEALTWEEVQELLV